MTPRLTLRSAASTVLALAGLYMAGLAVVGLSAHPRPCALAVVFGNAVDANGQPSARLRARLETALALYRAGMVRRVMVSGGIERQGDRNEASAMAAWLEAGQVPPAAIVEDPDGTDTMATARHVAAVAAGGGAIAVSQWFHLPRAMLAMRGAGMRDVSGAWPRFVEVRDVYSFLREGVAVPFYAVRLLGADAMPAPAARWKPPA